MIQCLFNSGSQFYNYKSFYSTAHLAVTSADYRFVMVDVSAYGNSNDSGLLNSTTFLKRLKKKILGVPPSKKLPNDMGDVLSPHLFVQDETFPLSYDLLRPYSRKVLTNNVGIFNYRLSHARRMWRILLGFWKTIGDCITGVIQMV